MHLQMLRWLEHAYRTNQPEPNPHRLPGG